MTIVYLSVAYWDVVAFGCIIYVRYSSTGTRPTLDTRMKTIMTCSLSVNLRTAHHSPVFHISQHPPHNVNYNNNTSSARMRRTEGRKGIYIYNNRQGKS
jgi:hypothetical protein